jgi:transposase-like protein
MDKRVTSGKDTRRRHSEELKQELVERSLESGASVAAIAQEHGINANLLFNWRRLRLRAEAPAVEAAAPPTLLPVRVQMDPVSKAPTYTNDSGFYADAVVQSGRHRYMVQPMLSGGVESKGNSLLASIEVGQALALGSSCS